MKSTPQKPHETHEEETRATFNRLKPFYDQTWDQQGTTLHVGLFQNEQDTLEQAYTNATERLFSALNAERQLDEHSVLLDIGCGAGRTLLTACERFGCRGIGIDLSDAQIADAEQELARRNQERALERKPSLDIRFIRGSASDLSTLLKGTRCTHAMSQDAIMLVGDKHALFQGAFACLEPGGVLVAFDFIEEKPRMNEDPAAHLLYDVVNWKNGLSLSAYQSLLLNAGFAKRCFTRFDDSMIRTYELLAERLTSYEGQQETYKTLRNRYVAITDAVRAGTMGWILFSACKQPRRALLCGTKSTSLGRAIAQSLHANGWDIWLYSRQAKHLEKDRWHERACDLRDPLSIERLLNESGSFDAVYFLADSRAHAVLEGHTSTEITDFIGTKITGALHLARALLCHHDARAAQWVWCMGRPSKKPKDLLLYSVANSAMAQFVEELNRHYPTRLQAYYIPTNIVSPSTMGDLYLKKHPEASPTEHPDEFAQRVQQTLRTQKPGMTGDASHVL